MNAASLSGMWWLIQKDLRCEWRGWRVWPRLASLGLAVAFLLSYQLALPGVAIESVVGSLCWITIGIASLMTLGETMAAEADRGCWDALKLYPIGSTSLFFAKMIVHSIGIGVLQWTVVPFLLLTTDVGVSDLPRLCLVMCLGNVAISALGTVVGGLSIAMRSATSLPSLLLLPLWVPVVLAGAKATTLIVAGTENTGTAGFESWRWIQFLAASAVVYVAVGAMLFEFAIEE